MGTTNDLVPLRGRHTVRRSATVVLACLLGLSGAQAQTSDIARTIIAAKSPPGTQLVDVSRESRDALVKIGEQIQRGELGAAIEGLHVLLTSESPGLHPHWSNIRRHVSIVEAVVRLLAEFPDEVLRAYGGQHETAARRLYENAVAASDNEALLRIGRRYFYSPHGVQALNRYGQWAFDRGDYLDAAYVWEALYRYSIADVPPRPLLAAKTAAGYHLGGAEPRAQAMLAELQKTYAGATTVIAGRPAPLAEVVTRSFRTPPPRGGRRAATLTWPSATGSPDATAIMSPCAVSPLTVWRHTDAERMANIDAILHRSPDEGSDYGPVKISTEIRDARVQLLLQPPGEGGYRFSLPALIHPLVLNDTVVCRREQDVVAFDAVTGRQLWQLADFPVHDMTGAGRTRNHYLPLGGDMGRHTATYAEGLVFAVGRFRRVDPETYRKFASTLAEDSCSLVAVSAEDGKLVWELGRGKGDSESVRSAKFLSAPTHVAGHLFALAKVGNRYRLLCLDARTGEVVWDAAIGPIPTHTGEQLSWQAAYTMELMTERASPVAAAGNRVFLTTNSGLIAGYDGIRGEPLWTYRYDSGVSGRADSTDVREVANLAFLVSAARKPFLPQNPVIVSAGRVICMPCDSSSVLALHALSGELLWEVPRNGARHLAAIDDQRILLCGPGMSILSAADGSVIRQLEVDVADRPAVTTTRIIASGRGQIVQVDLADYSVDSQPVGAGGALLGTLVSAGGRLVAANTAGVSVFLGFDDAWALLSEKVAATKDAARMIELLTQRGTLAYQADRLELAQQELEQAYARAKSSGAKAAAQQIRPWLYRLLLRRAQSSTDDDAAGKLLVAAAAHASTNEERVRADALQIRYHERAGRPAKAGEIAQSMTEKYPDTTVTLPPGFPASAASMSGYTYGHDEIRRLTGKHGRAAYGACDGQLAAALDAALKTGDIDAMAEAYRRWPYADRAGELLVQAAETVYRLVDPEQRGEADRQAAARASRLLGAVENCGRDELLTTARAAQVLVDARFRPAVAGLRCAQLVNTPTNTPVKFAGFEGTVTDVIRLGSKTAPPAQDDRFEFAHVQPPLHPRFHSPDAETALLRDAEGRPVVVGDTLFAHTADTVFGLDARRDTYEQSVLWQIAIDRDGGLETCIGYADDRLERLAIITAEALVITDIADGRELMRTALSTLGVGPRAATLGYGPRVVFADRYNYLTCVSLTRLEREWRQRVNDLVADTLSAGCDLIHGGSGRGSRAWIFDIRTGRQIRILSHGQREPRGASAMNCDGFVATIESRRRNLEFYDPRRDQGALSQTPLGETALYEILHFGYRFVVLRDSATKRSLRFHDIAGEHAPVEVTIKGKDGNACYIARASTTRNTAFLLCADAEGHGGVLNAPRLVALNLPDGHELWRHDLAGGNGELIAGPHRFGRILSLSVRPEDDASPCRDLVIDGNSGDTLLAYPPVGAEKATPRLWEWAGAPAVMNGSVFLETSEGLLCLRGTL